MRRSSAQNFGAKWLADERDCYSLNRFDSEVIWRSEVQEAILFRVF